MAVDHKVVEQIADARRVRDYATLDVIRNHIGESEFASAELRADFIFEDNGGIEREAYFTESSEGGNGVLHRWYN